MWFEIKENGEVIKATMKDEQIVEVPNTEQNKSFKKIFTGIGLIIIGAGVVVYANKKNKK